MSRQVIVEVGKDGKVKVEANGYVGHSCHEATAALAGLGRKTDEETKPEFFEQKLDVDQEVGR